MKELPKLLKPISHNFTTLTEEEMLRVEDQPAPTQSAILHMVRRWPSVMWDFYDKVTYLFY